MEGGGDRLSLGKIQGRKKEARLSILNTVAKVYQGQDLLSPAPELPLEKVGLSPSFQQG